MAKRPPKSVPPKTTKVRVVAPTHVGVIRFPIEDAKNYYSYGDEDRFYHGLYRLPEFVDVRWDGVALQLTLRVPIRRDSIQELIALFTRYQVSLKWLLPVIEALPPRRQVFFRRPGTYWFKELFGKIDGT